MAWISGEELERLQQQAAESTELSGRLADMRNERDQALGRVAVLESAVDKIPHYTKALEEASRTNIREIAAEVAIERVRAITEEELTVSLTESLIAEHGDAYAADFKVEQGPKIQAELHELFQHDGTYEEERRRRETAIRHEVSEELITNERAKIDAELGSKKSRERFVAEAKAALLESDELTRYRHDTKEQLEAQWSAEAEQQARAIVNEEEAARKDAFIEQYVGDYLESSAGQRLRERTRANYEEEWKALTKDEVVQRINDEELTALHQTQLAIQKEQTEREVLGQQLAHDFEGMGLDTTAIPEGTQLDIFLGSIGIVKVTEKGRDRYGQATSKDVPKVSLDCKRKLSLAAMGEGKYIVIGDSLHTASEYAQNDAIPIGKIISIGRCVQEQTTQKLDQRLAADVPFYWDDDTSTPQIINGLVAVANVVVNGIPARQVDIINMV